MRTAWNNHGRLLGALLLASLLHAFILLGISFDWPKSKDIDKSLDVVLVVKPSPKPPAKADFLAQDHQKGGGESRKRAVPRSIPNPIPMITPPKKVEPIVAPSPRRIVKEESAHPPATEEKAELEPVPEEKPATLTQSEPKAVLTQARSEKKITADVGTESPAEPAPQPRHLSADLLSQQITEVTTVLNKSREAQAKQKRFVYSNLVETHKNYAAAYEAEWQEKVERIGNLNYPEEAARHNLEGSVMLAVGINGDGSLYSIQVRQSSGEPIIDRAAEQIVRLVAPFAPLPTELMEEGEVFVITRIFRFDNNHVNTGL
jgi:protein TonB